MKFIAGKKYLVNFPKNMHDYELAQGLLNSINEINEAPTFYVKNKSIFLCLNTFPVKGNSEIYHLLSLSDLTLFSGYTACFVFKDFKIIN
jgi:hypothetical protein